MDPTVWIMIMEMIMELLKRLQEEKDEETLLRRLAKPRLHETRIVFFGLRDKGLRGKELRQAARAVLQETVAMSREEHVKLLAAAKDHVAATPGEDDED